MSDIYFSMIVYVDNDELLKKAIRSIAGNFELMDKTKIIVADGVCSELSMKLCYDWQKEYGEEHFCYLKTYQMPVGEAYNVAIPEIKGRYVNFSLASTGFQTGALEIIWELAENLGRPKLISLAPWTINEKAEHLQYKMSPAISSNKYEEIDLIETPDELNLMFHSYFIRCYLIKSKERNMWFKPELHEDAVMEMLLNLLAEIKGYVYIPRVKLNYTVALEDNTSTFIHQHSEWWYMNSLRNWIIPFAEKWSEVNWPLRKPIQIALLYLVFARYNCNYNDRNKGVLLGEQVNEFAKLSGVVFQYIDNELILKNRKNANFSISRTMRILFLRLKAEANEGVCEVTAHGDGIYLWSHKKAGDITEQSIDRMDSAVAPDADRMRELGKELGQNSSLFLVYRQEGKLPEFKWAFENTALNSLSNITKEHVILNAINYNNGKLDIDGTCSVGDFLQREQISLWLIKDKREYKVKFSEVYGLNKVFGVTYNHKYCFHCSIPAFSLEEKSEMQFMMEYNGKRVLLEIRVGSVYAHVRADIRGQYWHFCEEWCLNIAEKNKLKLTHVTPGALKAREAGYREELNKRARKGDIYAKKALQLRAEYFQNLASAKDQRIWITFDKLYKAGDNGEYMYDYVSGQKDGIDIRYIIKEDSPDYERMLNKGDKLLVWGSDECLLTVLYAEAILTTHANIVSYSGFDKPLIPYICDLFNAKNICIQHGLTTQNIAQFQNRLFDNLGLYVCASPNEIENLSRPIYGFTDKNALKLTGVARYDGLKSNDQKQILITPTWRRNIANSNVAHVRKGHNEYFKSSEYYRIYNTLINDPVLIECAKKSGYRIIYLLHPAASAQIDDFDRNDYVEIIPAASDMNYEKILTESSLMVTDYSGVQFDFAYMRKPLLYYHPKSLPPHYDESKAYVYETMAFGPIIDNHEELVKALCSYMKAKCVMEPEYVERADRFFAYKDYNNCERIYRAILEYTGEGKGE